MIIAWPVFGELKETPTFSISADKPLEIRCSLRLAGRVSGRKAKVESYSHQSQDHQLSQSHANSSGKKLKAVKVDFREMLKLSSVQKTFGASMLKPLIARYPSPRVQQVQVQGSSNSRNQSKCKVTNMRSHLIFKSGKIFGECQFGVVFIVDRMNEEMMKKTEEKMKSKRDLTIAWSG